MAGSDRLDALELRLAKVEKQNRLLRVGLVLLPLLAIAGWKSSSSMMLEAETVRADRFVLNTGEGSVFVIESMMSGNEKLQPMILMGTKGADLTIQPSQLFMTKGEDNETLNTILEGGRLTAYHNLGDSPSAELKVEKGSAGLEIRTSKGLRDEAKEATLFFGSVKDEGGAFVTFPGKKTKKILAEPFAPPTN